MFVVDHPEMVRGIDPALDGATDIEIIGTYSPADDILTVARVHRPDVVVIDYDMPGLDAAVTVRGILSEEPSTQVLMLSLVYSADDIRHAMRSGARDYLVKPLHPGELVETIRWLIRERREYARMQAFVGQMRKAYEALFTDDKPVPPTVVALLEDQAARSPHDRLAQETLAVAYARNRDWNKLAPLAAELARTQLG
jgi:DNA-binding NarL/FixJ family response regulator